jgi:aldehyde:ferredoxin oxidoreductase
LVGKWRQWERGAEGAYVSKEVLQDISKKFFGDVDAVDYTTQEGKGRGAKLVQDRWSARESMVLCAFAWPITTVAHSADHCGDPTLEAQVFSAVTGRQMDEQELNTYGEVIYNLRRAVFAREGRKGRESESIPPIFYEKPFKDKVDPEDPCLVPGKDGKAIPRKGAVVDREAFEKLKDDYYHARGWDVPSGLQTRRKLEELGLEDVAKDLEMRGLVV